MLNHCQIAKSEYGTDTDPKNPNLKEPRQKNLPDS